MTLTRKTLTLSLLTFVGLVLAVYAVSSHILRSAFDSVERGDCQESVNRVDAVVADVFQTMKSITDDWGEWNETYNYVKHPNDKFRTENLNLATFNALKIDVMVIVGPADHVIYAQTLNRKTGVLESASLSMVQALMAHGTLVRFKKVTSSVSGFLLIGNETFMVVGHPVITSDHKGDIAGALIVGRLLDARQIQHISTLTGHPIQIRSVQAGTALDDYAEAAARFPTAGHALIRDLNEDTISGYATLRDIRNKPLLLVRVDSDRDISKKGRLSLKTLVWALLAACLVICVANVGMLRRLVLVRILSLSSGIGAVKSGGDLSTRLPVDGADELARLAEDINGMLSRIEHSQGLLLQNEERRVIIETIADGIVIVDENDVITLTNTASERMLDIRRSDIQGKRWTDIGWSLLRLDGTPVQESELPSHRVRATNETVQDLELCLRRTDGKQLIVMAAASPLHGEAGAIVGVMLILSDITERKMLEERLIHQAYHDPLTGLPNRALFYDRVSKALARTERSHETVAVLFIDVDNFKYVNDSLGHAMGDMLLTTVAHRLEKCLRGADSAARLGGDEFTALLDSVNGLDSAVEVANRIAEALSRPLMLGSKEIFITLSIGIAVSSLDTTRPDDLLQNADAAMYEAKSSGKGQSMMFKPGMNSQALERMEMQNDLRRALERNEFVIHYQPSITLLDSDEIGVEALLRWQHPTRGLVSPSEFVPVAEQSGLIIAIGRWVIQQACRQIVEWRNVFPNGISPSIAVNLSGRQFQDPNLIQDINGALLEHDVPASSLVFEITESVVMEEAEETVTKLQALKDMGLRLAIDDFGTGYSSLSYLKRFPMDFLKIDRSFVQGLGQDADDAVIISATISLAHALGLTVIAEGAETMDQVDRLRSLGCDMVQGYAFARPLPKDEIQAFFQHRITEAAARP